jgi:HEAT repeat protein
MAISMTSDPLAKIGPEEKEVIPALIQALDDESIHVRTSAVRALTEIGPAEKEVISALIQALDNQYVDVRTGAVRALKAITGQDFGEDPARWQQWWEEQK